MTWSEKIQNGINLIAQGCRENEDWTECKNCPFDNYCTTLLKGMAEDDGIIALSIDDLFEKGNN